MNALCRSAIVFSLACWTLMSPARAARVDVELDRALTALGAAHDATRAYETTGSFPAFFPRERFDAPTAAIAESSRHIRWMTHPITGKQVMVFAEQREQYDGAGRVRIELHHLTTGGPGNFSAAAQIWTADFWAKVAVLDAPVGELHIVDAPDANTLLAQKRGGVTPNIELRAAEGTYLDRALFVHRVLTLMPDSRTSTGESGEWLLSSSAYGLDARVDSKTGELLSYLLLHPWGCERVWFEGRFDDALLPGRHPRELRSATAHGSDARERVMHPTPEEIGVFVYTSARRIDPPDPSLFRWQSIAHTVVDYSVDAVRRTDGSIDPDATERLQLQARATEIPVTRTTPGGTVVPARPGWATWRRLGLAFGAACLLVAGVVRARKHAA